MSHDSSGRPDAADRSRRQLESIARFANRALRPATSLTELLQAACEAACSGSDIELSKTLLHDPERDDLVIRAGVGWRAGVIGMRVPAHARSAPGRTLRSGTPLIVNDVFADPTIEVHEPLASHGIVCLVNVPIAVDGTVLGVLELDSPKPLQLDESDIAFLSALAAALAAAVKRAEFEQVAVRAEQRLRDSEQRLRESEQRLHESERRLRMALGAARMGTWLRRRSTGEQMLDRDLSALLGLASEQTVLTFEQFLALIHPEDRAAADEAFAHAFDTSDGLSVDFRVSLPDRTVRWLRDEGHVVLEGKGPSDLMTGVCIDVTERKEAELRLQRADRTKTEFLAMLAHELRNPMAPLRNAVSLLEHGTDDMQRTQIALGIMHRQLGQLARLVGDLLEVSRLEQGKIELRIESIVLASALGAAIETVQPLIEARGQRLSVTLPSVTMRIPADAVRITQVVANLLNNAAKFTPEGGAIELAVEEGEREVAIVVRDEGVGILPEALPHIFGLFEQGSVQPLDRSQGGLGIGLALVRRLVQMHGGSVLAESAGTGLGAAFTVQLPRERATQG